MIFAYQEDGYSYYEHPKQGGMMKKLLVFLCAMLLVFGIVGMAGADMIINPSDTATACKDIFRCGAPALSPGIVDDFRGFGPLEQRSAIEFSLEGITDLQIAELFLVATSFSPYPEFVNDPILEFHGYVGDGVIQYSDLFVDNLVFTTDSIPELGLYVFDVTDYVATLVNDGAGFVGFSVHDIMPNSHVSFYPGSSLGTGSNTLVVNGFTPPPDPIPEPATILLLGSGLAGLLGFGRKKLFKK